MTVWWTFQRHIHCRQMSYLGCRGLCRGDKVKVRDLTRQQSCSTLMWLLHRFLFFFFFFVWYSDEKESCGGVYVLICRGDEEEVGGQRGGAWAWRESESLLRTQQRGGWLAVAEKIFRGKTSRVNCLTRMWFFVVVIVVWLFLLSPSGPKVERQIL